MKRTFRCLFLLVITLIGFVCLGIAQPGPPPTPKFVLDTTFNSNLNIPNEEIITVLPQGNTGKFIIETRQTAYPYQSKIYRLNSNGTLDTTFQMPALSRTDNLPPPFPIRLGGVLPDGRILIHGRFHKVNNVVRPFIALLGVNGNLDPNFNINFYPYTAPQMGDVPQCNITNPEVVFQMFNMLPSKWDYVFQYSFSSGFGICPSNQNNSWKINGQSRIGWARMNLDQVAFNSFIPTNPSTSTVLPSPGSINQISQNSSGEVILKGDFMNLSGTPRTRIAKLNFDGSLSSTFNPVFTSNFSPNDVAVDQMAVNPYNGKVLVKGRFHKVNGTTLKSFAGVSLAYLNTNGTLDTTFFANRDVRQVNPDVLEFAANESFMTAIEGTPAKLLTVSKTIPFGVFTLSTFNGKVNVIQIQLNGKVIVAGNFTNVNGTPAAKIALLK